MWLGLRPIEVDSLKGKKWKLKKQKVGNRTVPVLSIYQSKVMGLPEDQRYKHIPILFAEQYECLELIKSQEFTRPHSKTVKKHLNSNVTLYGGRKGFTDLMLSKEQKIEDISIWLGHTSIETTWKHYKDRKNIRFTDMEEVVSQLRKIG